MMGCSGQASEPVETKDEPFSTGLSGEPIHEQVTAEGLSFLKPEIVFQLAFSDVLTDIFFVLESSYHVDDCNFGAAFNAVANEERIAVGFLDPKRNTPETTRLAILAFGRALHTVQDFYAHSNWVESGAEGLINDSLGPWPAVEPYSALGPSGLVVVSGTPPAGTTVSRDAAASYPASALVTVERDGTQSLGLISGSVDYEPGDQCPSSIAMTHDDLNKDRSTLVGREAEHARAKQLATEQTTHEWCRLVELTRQRWGKAGEKRLQSWISRGATPPACGG